MISLYDSSITDILPDALKNDPRVEALGYAIKMAMQRFIDSSVKTRVFSDIDDASEEVIDLLAIELRTQYYDTSLPLSVKRDLVKNTFSWHRQAGTLKALEELVTAVFGSGEIIEWWNDTGADPYTYKVRAEVPITGNEVTDFGNMVSNVVNVRSRLSAVEFTRNTSGECWIGCGQNAYTISRDIREGGT